MSKVYEKIYKKSKLLKTIGLAATSVFAIATLASCKASGNVYSGIDSNGTYSTIGNYSVTNYELFEELAWDAADELDKYVVKAMCSTYYDQVVSAVEDSASDEYASYHDTYVEQLREYFIVETYGVDDMDSYYDINSADTLSECKQKTLDTLYTNGINLSSTSFDALVEVASDGESLVELKWSSMNSAQQATLKQYYTTLAQKLFAKNYLEEEIADYEDDQNDDDVAETDEDYVHYYTDSQIISYWKENYYYKNSTANAIMIRFVSSDEVTETLKTFGVKLYKSKFYFIKQEGVIKDGVSTNISNSDYDTWYEDFDFTAASNESNYSPLDDSEVLQLYVEMYNYIYPYRDQLPERDDVKTVSEANSTNSRRDVTAAIINSTEDEISAEDFYETYIKTCDAFEEYIQHSATDLEEVNSSLRNFLYEDLDDYEYSTSGTSNSDYYYMAYKFEIDATALEESGDMLYYESDVNGDVTQKDEDGNDELADSSNVDRIRCADLVAKIIEGLKDDDLTDTYIESALNDSKDDAKISIYDEHLSIAYAVGYSDYYTKTYGGSPEDDVVAKVVYDGVTTYIYTSDLYKELEAADGITSAIDLLTKQIIKDTEEYAATEAYEDDYYTQLNNVLTSFANDGLSSYGYSSSIGKYNFLMMYFHSSDVEEIINNVYRVNAASSELLNNYASDTDLIELFVKYCEQAYNNSFTVSATSLLVYVDMDEDGNADENFDWSTECTYEGSTTTYAEVAKSLINYVSTLLENSTDSYADTLSSIVDEYSNSTRFTNGYDTAVDTNGNYDPTEAETYWAKYKRLGIYLTTETYDSVTNSTDSSTASAVIKEELQDIYNRDDFIYDSTAPSEYLDTEPYENNGDGIVTTKGYNLIVVTSATINASAKFESTDDVNGIYSNLYYWYNEELTYISNLYNDGDTLTFNQILAYILEYADNSTSNTIPSDVSDAISSFFTAVYTKYTDSATQRELLIYWCEYKTNSEFVFTNTLNSDSSVYVFTDGSTTTYAERFEEIRNINKRSADSYCEYLEFNTSVYDDWWGDLENYIKAKYGN